MAIRVRCHQCQALMQVVDSAAGKRARCPKCSATVSIPVTAPGTDEKRPATPKPSAAPATSSSPKQPARSQPAAAASGSKQGAGRQIRCPKCQHTMRAAAGSTVRCPGCQANIKIPAAGITKPASPKTPAHSAASSSPAASSDLFDFDDLPPSSPAFPAGAGAQSFGASPRPSARPSRPAFGSAGPYASPHTVGGGGKARRKGSLPSGRSPWHYTVPSVLFGAFGIILALGIILRIVGIVLVVSNAQAADIPAMFFVQNLVGIVITAVLAVAYMMGASAMRRRENLSVARIVSVVAAIPCFNCLVLTPIGIWACVLTFSAAAQQDFKD